MPQLSLYLDDATMSYLRESSRQAGLSLSKWAAALINDRRESGTWPAGYWDVYGALSDASFALPPELDAADDDALPSFA